MTHATRALQVIIPACESPEYLSRGWRRVKYDALHVPRFPEQLYLYDEGEQDEIIYVYRVFDDPDTMCVLFDGDTEHFFLAPRWEVVRLALDFGYRDMST